MSDTTREHPILFSGAMVRALLDGRKTQTRRPVTAQTALVNGGHRLSREAFLRYPLDKAWVDRGPSPAGNPGPYLKCDSTHPDDDGAMARLYPPWQVGDRLWVRETWAAGACADMLSPTALDPATWLRDNGGLWYQADDAHHDGRVSSRGKWRPSIHMPRWASRLTLEITRIRAHRIQDISEEDALAEGIEVDGRWHLGSTHPVKGTPKVHASPLAAFRDLWAATYGAAAWEHNPWVWALDLRRV